MSAFEGTPLDIALRDCGVTTVVIVGVATEIEIEPTVRHAVELGYLPVLVTDACGAGNEEAGPSAPWQASASWGTRSSRAWKNSAPSSAGRRPPRRNFAV
jgi:nicotinamidase-related amidase